MGGSRYHPLVTGCGIGYIGYMVLRVQHEVKLNSTSQVCRRFMRLEQTFWNKYDRTGVCDFGLRSFFCNQLRIDEQKSLKRFYIFENSLRTCAL